MTKPLRPKTLLSLLLITLMAIETKVLKKKDPRLSDYAISYTPNATYAQFIGESAYIIDNSLLIEDITKKLACLWIVTLPKGFGKSFSLGMMKTFLQIEVYKNGTKIPINETIAYHLFRDGYVLHKGEKHELNDKFVILAEKYRSMNYLGRIPIIHLDFQNIDFSDRNSVSKFATPWRYYLYKMYAEMQRAFGRHEYLAEVYTSVIDNTQDDSDKQRAIKNRDIFNQYFSKTQYNAMKIQQGIPLLAELLHQHFNEKVYILIDEYDAPFQSILKCDYITSETAENISNSMSAMFEKMFTNEHVHGGMIAGVMKITDVFSSLGYAQTRSMLNGDLIKRYGFLPEDVEFVRNDLNLQNSMNFDQLAKDYNGYRFCHRGAFKVYNPSWVVQYLNDNIPRQSYWDEEKLVRKVMIKLMDTFTSQKALVALLYGHPVYLKVGKLDFTMEDYFAIRSLLIDNQTDCHQMPNNNRTLEEIVSKFIDYISNRHANERIATLGIKFLFIAGYFTYTARLDILTYQLARLEYISGLPADAPAISVSITIPYPELNELINDVVKTQEALLQFHNYQSHERMQDEFISCVSDMNCDCEQFRVKLQRFYQMMPPPEHNIYRKHIPRFIAGDEALLHRVLSTIALAVPCRTKAFQNIQNTSAPYSFPNLIFVWNDKTTLIECKIGGNSGIARDSAYDLYVKIPPDTQLDSVKVVKAVRINLDLNKTVHIVIDRHTPSPNDNA